MDLLFTGLIWTWEVNQTLLSHILLADMYMEHCKTPFMKDCLYNPATTILSRKMVSQIDQYYQFLGFYHSLLFPYTLIKKNCIPSFRKSLFYAHPHV